MWRGCTDCVHRPIYDTADECCTMYRPSFSLFLSRSLALSLVPHVIVTPCKYYPQSTAPDMVKMAEKEIPGVVLDHKKAWRKQKRDLDEGTNRGESLLQKPRDTGKTVERALWAQRFGYHCDPWPVC